MRGFGQMSRTGQVLAWTAAPVVGTVAGLVVARAAVIAAAGVVVMKLGGNGPNVPANQARGG